MTYLKLTQAKPLRPMAMVMQVTAETGIMMKAVANMKTVWLTNPPHVKYLRT